MERAREANISRSRRAREELAKAWLIEMLERTPLERVAEVPIDWVVREAPPLIADIVAGIADPGAASELELPAPGLERIGGLGALRRGEDAPAQIPRDLAALQSLLVEALRRDVPERRVGGFAGSVGRLAEIFGGIQAQVNEELVHQRSGDAEHDPLTGLPGQPHLHEWLRILLAEHRRYGHPFALLMIDVEGLGRINAAYGRDAGDRMLAAVAGVVTRQIRSVDRAFRLREDEFGVLAPHRLAGEVRPLAERLCQVVDRSQAEGAPRLAVAAGIAACPEHGDEADALLASAEEAAWAAKAAGRAVDMPGSY